MSLLTLIGFKSSAPARQVHLPPLSPTLFGELTGFDQMRKGRLGDRRRRPRLAREGALQLVADVNGRQTTHVARIRDVSAEGISLATATPLPLGTRFITELDRLIGDGRVVLVYEVRRCVEEPDGGHFIGGSLIEYRC